MADVEYFSAGYHELKESGALTAYLAACDRRLLAQDFRRRRVARGWSIEKAAQLLAASSQNDGRSLESWIDLVTGFETSILPITLAQLQDYANVLGTVMRITLEPATPLVHWRRYNERRNRRRRTLNK